MQGKAQAAKNPCQERRNKCFCDDAAQNRNFRTRKPAIRSRKSAVQPRISLHEYRMEGSFEHEEEYTDEYGD